MKNQSFIFLKLKLKCECFVPRKLW